jgi:transposase-like protein
MTPQESDQKPTTVKSTENADLTISSSGCIAALGCEGDSLAQWVAAMVKKLKELDVTQDEDELEFQVLSRLAVLMAKRRESRAPGHAPAKNLDTSGDFNARYAKLPLLDVIPEYLEICKKPQTTKQIAVALKAAGREFESKMEVRAVRDALKKLLVANENIFHLGWSKWHLKSKYSKAKMEKLLAGTHNGTGGRSPEDHGARTKAALAKRRAAGKRMGPERKLTPEVIEKIKMMLGQPGARVGAVAKQLGIATSSIYGNGISKRDCRQAAKLKAESENTGGGHVRLVASNE